MIHSELEHSEARALELLWTTLFSSDGRAALCGNCNTERLFHRVSGRRAYACDHCGAHVYPAAATPFAGSPTPLATWLSATATILAAPAAITPRHLGDTLGLSYKTAWRMRKRIDTELLAGGEGATILRSLAAAWGQAAPQPPTDPTVDLDSPEDRISAAACRVMAVRGLPATRIADIAREAGISSAAVHYYFRSKDDVLQAAFRWAGEQLNTRLQRLRGEDVDPMEHVRRLLELSVPSDQVLHDEYLLWLEVWVRAKSHPYFLDDCMTMSRRWREAILDVLGKGIAGGAFHPIAPLEDICEWYIAMAGYLAYRSALGYVELPPERAKSILAGFLAGQLSIPASTLAG